MKNHPTKKARVANGPGRPPLPMIGELLREEFRKPLDVALEQIAAAVLPDPLDQSKPWVGEIRSLWSKEPDGFLLVDVSLALDRVFGCPYGYFLTLWATSAARSRAKKRQAWLAKVQPLPKGKRLPASWAPGGRRPEPLVTTHQLHDWAEMEFRCKRGHRRSASLNQSKAGTDVAVGRKLRKGIRP